MTVLAPGLVRMLAPNPSALTCQGTNTYLLGQDTLCVIDPGPDDDRHLAALLAKVGTREVTAIVVTHAHNDHAALAPRLAQATGAPVLGFGGLGRVAGPGARLTAIAAGCGDGAVAGPGARKTGIAAGFGDGDVAGPGARMTGIAGGCGDGDVAGLGERVSDIAAGCGDGAVAGLGERVSDIAAGCGDGDVAGLGERISGIAAASCDAGAAGLRERSGGTAAGFGKGVDHGFVPDRLVREGDVMPTDVGPLRVIHTPGHLVDHIALVWGDAVFCGDTVMGWASSLVSPPDGDMGDYMRSLARLAGLGARVLYPGHGAPVTDPAGRIAELIAHRQRREAQVIAALTQGPLTVAALTALLYHDTAPALHPAAARNVLAHLIDLQRQNRVEVAGLEAAGATFRLLP